MTDEKIIAGWLDEARRQLAASSDHHTARLWRVVISGLEKNLQGVPSDEGETRAFRIAFLSERADPARLH